MSQGRDDRGHYKREVTDGDVLQVLRAQGDPVATVGELAEELPVSDETVRRRLTSLHREGRVGRKDVGARAVVWWVEGDDSDPPAAGVLEGDPLFRLPTAASGRGNVSSNIDEHLADAAADDQ